MVYGTWYGMAFMSYRISYIIKYRTGYIRYMVYGMVYEHMCVIQDIQVCQCTCTYIHMYIYICIIYIYA